MRPVESRGRLGLDKLRGVMDAYVYTYWLESVSNGEDFVVRERSEDGHSA